MNRNLLLGLKLTVSAEKASQGTQFQLLGTKIECKIDHACVYVY